MLSQQDSLTHVQVVANGDIAGAPASAGNLADLLSLDAEDAAGASATASSAVTALQDLLSGDLSGEVAAAGNPSQILLSHLPQASSVSDPLVLIDRCTTTRGFDSRAVYWLDFRFALSGPPQSRALTTPPCPLLLFLTWNSRHSLTLSQCAVCTLQCILHGFPCIYIHVHTVLFATAHPWRGC